MYKMQAVKIKNSSLQKWQFLWIPEWQFLWITEMRVGSSLVATGQMVFFLQHFLSMINKIIHKTYENYTNCGGSCGPKREEPHFFFFYNLTVLSLFGNNYILFIKAQIYANCSASGWICRHSNTRTAYSIDVLQFFLLVFPFKNDFQMS